MTTVAENDNRIMAKSIKSRLRRIEGQLKGIEKMIDQQCDCRDIIIQISAVRAATSRVGVIIFENHLKDCLGRIIEQEEKDEAMAELLKLMHDFIR